MSEFLGQLTASLSGRTCLTVYGMCGSPPCNARRLWKSLIPSHPFIWRLASDTLSETLRAPVSFSYSGILPSLPADRKTGLLCCFPASIVIFRGYKILASWSENIYWILTQYLFSMTCWPADLNPRYSVSFKSIDVLRPPQCSRCGSSSKFGSWHSAFMSKHMTQSGHSSTTQRKNQKNPLDVYRIS